MSQSPTINPAILGIDVSKDKLCGYLLDNGQRFEWKNETKGLEQGIKDLKRQTWKGMIVLERTGGYEKLAHQLLSKAGYGVHVAHPRRVHHFIQQKGYFAKTDPLDAKAIAEYGHQEQVQATPVASKAEQQRQELCARRAQLTDQMVAEKCRLKTHLERETQRSIERSIKWIKREIAWVNDKLEQLIVKDAEALEKTNRLMSYQGVGKQTAHMLISLLPELGGLTRSQVACLCGLAPRNKDSGRKCGRRQIAGGRSMVRKSLYMVALAAITHNDHIKHYYQSLKERNKASKVALVAVMRKIIITLNAMLRDKKDYCYQS